MNFKKLLPTFFSKLCLDLEKKTNTSTHDGGLCIKANRAHFLAIFKA